MLTGPEFVLLFLIVFVVLGLHKLPKISSAIARWRLAFDGSIDDNAIEAVVENRDDDDHERD